MRQAPSLASRGRRFRRSALVAIVISMAATVAAAAGRPHVFDEIPEPVWTPEIRAPEEIVPRTESPAAASWLCLEGADPLAAVRGLERLIRISVVLEVARSPRAEVLAARTAAIEAGKPLLIAITEALEADLAGDPAFAAELRRPDWLPTMLDPLSPAFGGLELEAWRGWEALLPPDGSCRDDTATITDRAVAIAMLIRQRDGAFLSSRGTLAELAREGRWIAVGTAAGVPDARLADLVDTLDLALLSLDAAEARWAQSSTRIAELVDSEATSRGVVAAERALSLQAMSRMLAQSDDPRAAAGVRLVERSAGMIAASAARFAPGLIVEQPTVLDLEFATDDSPRRAAVAALMESLELQLPMLERLYEARTSREAGFAAMSGSDTDPLRETLERRAVELWSRLAHAVRRLGERDLPQWRRAWGLTEIGRVRDQLLPLEAALSQMQQDALWMATGNQAAFDDAVDRQQFLIAEIGTARRSETGPTAELQRSVEILIEPAAETAGGLARLLEGLRTETDDGEVRDFLKLAADFLSERAATLRAGEDLRRELHAGSNAADHGPLLSFRQASLSLAGVRDLERLLATRAAAERAVRGIARPRATPDRDAALLEAAYLLDLPVVAFQRGDEVTLTLGWGETAFETSIPVAPPDRQASAATVRTRTAVLWPAYRGANEGMSRWQPVAAVLTWSGSRTPQPLPWFVVRANSGDSTYDDFHLQPPTMPPGWIADQQRAQQNLVQTFDDRIKDAGQANIANYGLGVTLVAVGGLSGALPIAGVGGWILATNIGKDVLTGGAKAVNQAYGSPDPRVRAAMDRHIDKARWGTDMLGIVTGSVNAMIPAGLIDPFFSAAGAWVGALFPSTPPPPADPYMKKIETADDLIQKAFAAAKACQWQRARDLVNQARAEDPHAQCACWRRVGYRVIELANTWDGDVQAAKDTLAFARQRAYDEVYGCGLKAASLPADLARDYKNQARWACDTTFDREMAGLQLLGERLGGIENSLAVAEASCDRDEATGLARQVIAWADTGNRTYACAPAMRAAAETVLTWATQQFDGTAQRLADARSAIDRCDLERAEGLLDAPAPPSRCPEEGIAPGAIESTRRELRRLIEKRRADTARFTQLEQHAEILLENCDEAAMQSLLAELGRLEPCFDDDPYAAGIESRRHAIAERVRRSLELASEGTITQLDQAKDLLNEAILAAHSACDMQPARAALDRTREILKELWLSPCARLIFIEEIDHVSTHATYVEQEVDERGAVLARIRADFDAADAAFTAALQSCSEAGLDRAAAMLEAAGGGISALPIMTHSSCQAITRLRDLALESRDEALTLKAYWAGIEADLENARRTAAEGRGIGIDVHCAGVRQKAQPASCFQAELAECDRLSPSDSPTGGGTANVAPPPPAPAPPPAGGGSGASGGGSGRVQLDDPEPCARDVSWSQTRQRFECTCAGYRFDENLGRCMPGATTAVAVSQATCDAQYPGTRLDTDPETGLPACLCPSGTAWSGTHGRCLELMVAGGTPAGRTTCDPATGRFFNPSTGRCECTVGTWDATQGRCVDTAAADRQRAVEAGQKAAECERLYSDIQAFRRSSSAAHRQMAARAEAEAQRLGCDAGRIGQAIARGDRPLFPQPSGGSGDTGSSSGGSGDGAECWISSGTVRSEVTLVFKKVESPARIVIWVVSTQRRGVDSLVESHRNLDSHLVGRFERYGDAKGAATGACEGLPIHHNGPWEGSDGGGNSGTCQIHDTGGQGGTILVYEQQADGNHVNVYLFSANEEDVGTVRAHWSRQPGFSFVTSTASHGSAMSAARGRCAGRQLVN